MWSSSGKPSSVLVAVMAIGAALIVDLLGDEEFLTNESTFIVDLILFDNATTETNFCPGSIIGPRYVITAGSCLFVEMREVMVFGTGRHGQRDAHSIRPVNYIRHPNCSYDSLDYDLAILESGYGDPIVYNGSLVGVISGSTEPYYVQNVYHYLDWIKDVIKLNTIEELPKSNMIGSTGSVLTE